MMKKRKLGIIGGSGLYKMEGFEKTKWKKINTPWGKPSDLILKAEYKQNLLSLEKDQLYSLNLSALKCDFKNLITKDFYIIQTLIALCPVLGLLGTVTGMIEVFDVVSFFGTGNARALASGITKATLPTMTGMAISIVGLLTYTVLNSKSQSLISEL